jgi:hypothetical protein
MAQMEGPTTINDNDPRLADLFWSANVQFVEL